MIVEGGDDDDDGDEMVDEVDCPSFAREIAFVIAQLIIIVVVTTDISIDQSVDQVCILIMLFCPYCANILIIADPEGTNHW